MWAVRTCFLLSLLLGCLACTKSSYTLEDLYDLEGVGSIHIDLNDEMYSKLKSDRRSYVRGTVRYLDKSYKDVGVRLKGHRSMRPLGEKSAFKIRFDKFDPELRFLGVSDLTLNNLVEDKTMMREHLGYRLYRAMGVSAPDVGYAEVTVNGELYGLYAIVESVDASFLQRHFSETEGDVYEGEYGCDLYPDDAPFLDKDYGPGDRKALQRLADTTNAGAHELFYAPGHLVATDAFLAYLATSAFVSDFDGYRHSHNYRIYRRPSNGKWYFLPWGIDRIFKKDLRIYDSGGRLAEICFGDARCRRDFIATMHRVSETFVDMDLVSEMDTIEALTEEALKRDPKKPYSYSEILRARQELRDFIEDRPITVGAETMCLDGEKEFDRDKDGYGCLDCLDTDPSLHPGMKEACDGMDNDCNTFVDDDPACPCTRRELGSSVYHFCAHQYRWWEAKAFCEELGGALARVDSAEVDKLLFTVSLGLDDEELWWIGLEDRETEGAFRWVSAPGESDPGYTNWGEGQPDEDGCNQDCAALLDDDGDHVWVDTHCGRKLPFICQTETSPKLETKARSKARRGRKKRFKKAPRRR